MKFKLIFSTLVATGLLISFVPCSQAALVTVFLDNGVAPGSSNTATPFTVGGRDDVWDVTATAQPNLSTVGAAVMEVRLVTFNINANSRSMAAGGGSGLAVATGGNGNWFDGSTREAAAFQLNFYSDLAKTTEITGLIMTFDSVISRIHPAGTNLAISAYAGSGVLALSTNINDGIVSLGGTSMLLANDATLSFASNVNLVDSAPDLTLRTLPATGSVAFDEADTFWLRRTNLAGSGDLAYQLGAVTFDLNTGIIPEIGDITLEQLSGTNGLVLTWATVTGENYRLEDNLDLMSPSWATHTLVVGTGGDVTVTTAVDQVQSFYRVIPEPLIGTTYYVSSSAGSDLNLGTSPETAWETLTEASGTYGPGDKVLFKRGDSWSGEGLLIFGEGNENNPIVFDAYGSGDLPHFTNPTNQNFPFTARDSSYLEIRNLKISGGLQAIVFSYNHDFDNQSVTIRDCHIDGCAEVGIGLVPIIDVSEKNNTCLDGFLISGCKIDNCGASGVFNYLVPTEGSYNTIKNFEVENSSFEGNVAALNYTLTSGGFISNCTFTNNGGFSPFGTTTILMLSTSNITIEACEIWNTQRIASNDGCGLDFEGDNHSVTVDDCEFNYSDGAGVMIFGNPSANTDITIKNSDFVGNNVDPDNTGNGGDFEIVFRNNKISTGVIMSNNFTLIHSDAAYGSSEGTSLSGFVFSDNTIN